jgi:biotin carboxyl carrier protein
VRFQVDIAGRARTLDARRDGARWAITVDGRPVTVDMARNGERWSLLIGGRSYDVAVERNGPRDRTVHVDGDAISLALSDGRARRGESDDPPGHAGQSRSGPMRVVAPMPGRVVKLLVSTGDQVAARQGLVVIEAMKMENELRAPGAGAVTEVAVAAGTSVEAGTLLIVVT